MIIKIFSSTSAKGLEEVVNLFLATSPLVISQVYFDTENMMGDAVIYTICLFLQEKPLFTFSKGKEDEKQQLH